MSAQRDILHQLQKLDFPAPPTVVARLVGMLAKDSVTAEEIGALMALDASMAARVLQLANSVALAGCTPVDSIPEAVLRVGVDGVRDIVFSLAMAGAMRPAHFDYRPFWRHSLAVAFTAQSLQTRALSLGRPFPETYAAGLLHDVGMLVLDRALGTAYREVVEVARTTSRALVEVEHELLGTDHAQAGGRMLEVWRFPSLLVDAVANHHRPWNSGQSITHLVHLADFVCNHQGIHHGSGFFPHECDERVWAELGVARESLPEIAAGVQTELARAEAILAAM
ncbi:MAG: HDOD domain-containing protein [Opitutaceae bacterium]